MSTKKQGDSCTSCHCDGAPTLHQEIEQKLLDTIANLKQAEAAAHELSALAGGVGGILKQVGDTKTPDSRKPYLVKELNSIVKEVKDLAARSKNNPCDVESYAKKLFEAAIPKVAAELEKVPFLTFDDRSEIEKASIMIDEARAALAAIVDEVSGSRTKLCRELFALEVAHENALASQATLEEVDELVDYAAKLQREKHEEVQWLESKRPSWSSRLSISR
jgi:hypothetical protein